LIPFLPSALDADGVVTFASSGAVSWVGPQGYTPTNAVGVEAEKASDDVLVGGVRYTKNGAVRLYDATEELPAGSTNSGGFAITSDGFLCVTSDEPPENGAARIGGVAVTDDGRVYAVWD
jgi:hypothetical protein